MTQTNINIRIDEEVKKEAEHLFAELGLNMTTAVNLFIRQAIRQGGIPFEVTTQVDPFYNPANLKRLQESIQQIERGQGVQKTMQDLEHSNHA
ncbi:type II toxin-antitoxin system RelB/DinJ family antitoxin [Saccharibacillus brassicae]|uniref:Type II toxin-antitoxin system RelB/DinJ family antitoxin n=1 Tax=Saccharibacillus brassicae TaxID=2583377 RepID=A0A4Y6UX28_SACBS|nr:type II toxin-antitoxin system RelB/DinJ family antitoxin [Saccharibacillus brassicae]QDH21160.1 type II toxin-antitoxin system RelB/DinJ family antitoxin [Saccharibacillus brassicae]